jgi:surface antigen
MKRATVIALTIPALGLAGCMAVAKAGADRLFGDKDKPPAERIAAAQEAAIAAVHGGNVGAPIAWSDATSGIQGALMPQSSGDVPSGCRQYEQTVILAGETLQGRAVACAQGDGSWKLDKGSPQAKR